MGKLSFPVISLTWLTNMAAMVVIAPVGRHPLIFAVLFCLGHAQMILMFRTFPGDLETGRALRYIFALGLVARFFFLAYPEGNDVYRYVWEGYIQNFGYNPFKHPPDSAVLADIAHGEFHPIWRKINHPEITAIYPPVVQLSFRLFAWLNPTPFFFKTVMLVFDLGVMIVLVKMIKQSGISPTRLLLYAANPLILLYVSGEGHLDVIQVFFLCLALYLILYRGYHGVGFLMLGVAILSKYIAFIALPFLVNAGNRTKSLAVLIPLLLYIPFWDAETGLFKSLSLFSENFHYNGSINVLIRFFFADTQMLISACLLFICLLWVYLFVHNPLRSTYLALGCVLLFLPTLHPWYLVIITPFLVYFPSRAWLYFQLAVVFTFPVIAVEYSTGVFQEIQWLKLLEYLPFYGLLLLGLFKDGYLFRERFFSNPTRISVIVPTLNEEKNLARCLQALKHRTALQEVIVSDGGSTDGTRKIAGQHAAQFINSPKGRGLQVEKGIEAASGDVILILHADCVANKGVFNEVLKTLASQPHAVGGSIGMRFEQKGAKTWLVALLNNTRTILTGIAFGDQAQFFRKEALKLIGGYPAMMLMEDVELSLRLKEVGRIVFLNDGIIVSGRRWLNNRFSGNLKTVFHLFTRYLIERRFHHGDILKRRYYDIYYACSLRSEPNNRQQRSF